MSETQFIDQNGLTRVFEHIRDDISTYSKTTSFEPITDAVNGHIAGLEVYGKSTQYISPNLSGDVVLNSASAQYNNLLIATFPTIQKGKTYSISFDSNVNTNIYTNEKITEQTNYDIIVGRNSILFTVSKDLDMSNTAQYQNGWRLLKLWGNVETILSNIMINEGTTAIPYSPYTGTPSPDNPIDIVDVSGSITVHNKNLCNVVGIGAISQQDGYTIFADQTQIRYNDFIKILDGKSYYVSLGSGANIRTFYYDANRVFISSSVTGATILNIPNNAKYMRSQWDINGVSNVQIEYGTMATQYTEYESNAINLDGNINKGISNKNISSDGTTYTSGNIYFSMLEPIEVVPNSTITFSTDAVASNGSALQVFVGKWNGSTWLERVKVGTTSTKVFTWNVPPNTNKIYAFFYADQSAISGTYMQIESGSNATPYKSYADSYHLILRSVGNVKDSLSIRPDGSARYIQNVKESKIKNFSWTYDSTYNRFITYDAVPHAYVRTLTMLSDIYTVIDDGSEYRTDFNYVFYCGSEDGNVILYDTRYTTVAEWLADVGDHTLIYPLKTPIVTELSAEQVNYILSLETFKDYTSFETDLEGNVTYITDSSIGNAVADISAKEQSDFEYLNEQKVDNTKEGVTDAINQLVYGWTGVPTDNATFISEDTSGNKTYGLRRFSALWDYIQSKASLVFAKLKGSYIGRIDGNGQYVYCSVCTIKVNTGYNNNAITLNVSGRRMKSDCVRIMFASTSSVDPELSDFSAEISPGNFFISKTSTSTWTVYHKYPEGMWGNLFLHSISGNGVSMGSSNFDVTPTLSNVSTLPETYTVAYRQFALDGSVVHTSGDTLTGPLKWKDSTALPHQGAKPLYLLSIDAYDQGGTTKYIRSDETQVAYLKTPNALGYETDACGNLVHTGTGANEYFGIFDNEGSVKWKLYYETGKMGRKISIGTLAAGETSLTITDDRIAETSSISVYQQTSTGSTTPIKYKTINISTGAVTLTFDAQESQITVGITVDEFFS